MRKNSCSERVHNLSSTKHYPKNNVIFHKSGCSPKLKNPDEVNCNSVIRFSKRQLPIKDYNQQKDVRFSDWRSNLNFHQRRNQNNREVSREDNYKNLSLFNPRIQRYN